MSPATAARMTVEEFLALPQDDGVERLLINGRLWEHPMPERNRFHSRAMTCVATALELWSRGRPEPRGEVLTGDAGVRLGPDTSFGVDVTYVPPAVVAAQTGSGSTIVVGVPDLAVEILSPGEVWERHQNKIDACLTAGVKLVWVLDPRRRTVTVYRPGDEPTLVNAKQELTAPDVLPGFRVPAADLFG